MCIGASSTTLAAFFWLGDTHLIAVSSIWFDKPLRLVYLLQNVRISKVNCMQSIIQLIDKISAELACQFVLGCVVVFQGRSQDNERRGSLSSESGP